MSAMLQIPEARLLDAFERSFAIDIGLQAEQQAPVGQPSAESTQQRLKLGFTHICE